MHARQRIFGNRLQSSFGRGRIRPIIADEAEMTLTMQEQVFASMIKVGLPDVVVRQKMMIQGLDVQAQQAFFEST